MHKFQSFLKSIRESKDLEQQTVADATNLSINTIEIIENADNNALLQTSSTILKNQIRRYCEYLEVPEKKIVSILNKLDILYYKKSKYGKLKLFDYINRLTILAICVTLIVLLFNFVKTNVLDANNSDAAINQDDSRSSIIYTPINYEDQFDSTDSIDNANSQSKLKANPPTQANMDSIIIDEPTTDETKTQASSSNLKANPPSQANMDSIVIDEPTTDDSKTSEKISSSNNKNAKSATKKKPSKKQITDDDSQDIANHNDFSSAGLKDLVNKLND